MSDVASLPDLYGNMSDLAALLSTLESGEPFGFAHFNDGEIKMADDCERGSKMLQNMDYGWQKCTEEISKVMRSSLSLHFLSPAAILDNKHGFNYSTDIIKEAQRRFDALNIRAKRSNFYVGIPCRCEFRGLPHQHALHLLGLNLSSITKEIQTCPTRNMLNETSLKTDSLLYGRITPATLFINGNYFQAKSRLVSWLSRLGRNTTGSDSTRVVHVVTGIGHETNRLPFKNTAHFAPKEHAFEDKYETMRSLKYTLGLGHTESNDSSVTPKRFTSGDVVLLMLGPLGRILASEWTFIRSDVTFIDLGSFFDMVLWDRKHQLGKPRACMFVSDGLKG